MSLWSIYSGITSLGKKHTALFNCQVDSRRVRYQGCSLQQLRFYFGRFFKAKTKFGEDKFELTGLHMVVGQNLRCLFVDGYHSTVVFLEGAPGF